MNNRFIIIIGSRNNARWVKSNLQSVICQDYNNYKVLYFDDLSDDNTLELAKNFIGDNDKFTFIEKQSERKYKTWFFANYINDFNDNDILVFLDGDDMFSSENVLSYLNSVYNQTNCWMTYGGMRVWDGYKDPEEPYPQNSEIPDQVKQQKIYRKDTWRTSHLKTMKHFLWRFFDKTDLCPDGKYMVGPDDLAIMFGILEMCPPEKVYRITDSLYIYNLSEDNQFSRAYTDSNNTNYESIIRNRHPYDTLSVVMPTLAGGLGNQMFEIATAASLAKDNNAVLLINPTEHILPNQGSNVNVYLSNIFSRIVCDENLSIQNVFSWDSSLYKPISYSPNLKLSGHFQSWKYFDHNREYIQKLFSPTEDMKDRIYKKYNFDFSTIVGVQIRRGDYVKFPDHHPLVPVSYFQETMKQFSGKKFMLFTDDVDWCINNLDFDSFLIPDETDYMELYLMTLCSSLIISNSSFGWWGAYLNNTPNKQVYAPSTWFGKSIMDKGFDIDDLILPDWQKIKI